MANKLYEETSIANIAAAIRQKNGLSTEYKVGDMADAIKAIPSSGGVQKVEYHQCPENVRNYIANTTYDPSDYSTSSIDTYLTNTPQDSHPQGETIDDTTYYNLIPDKETPFASDNAAGTIKPLDFLRQIKPGTTGQNIRDLGGWTCDGGTVRYGKLIRGGEFSISDTATIQALRDVGVRAQLDLRGTASDWDASPLGTDVDFLRPVGEKDGEYWAGYRLDDTTPMRQAFRFIFDSVRRGRTLYFHCSAGADRTGTIACLIEGLLGVSQPDCDKDYELTSFVGSGYLRKRSGVTVNGVVSAGYKTLIERITALTVGTTFRDKIANYIASLGFTADEINAFRTAMIDGIPETLTISLTDYSVAATLTNVQKDNTATSVKQYSGYVARVTPANGYLIDSIKITMGGQDITASVFTGGERVLHRSVTLNLTNCTSSDNRINVVAGGCYAAKLTPTNGYTMQTVTVTMGGETVAGAYSDSYVIIPAVTGDIVITAIAVKPTVKTYTVTNNLTHVTSNNSATTASENAEYQATLTASSGYTISTVSITMGGVSVSQYYSNGVINIPSVTGDIVITATAVEDAPAYTDQLTNAINMAGTKIGKVWMYTGKRYSSSSGDPVDNAGTNITGLIQAEIGDTIRMRFAGTTEQTYNNIKCFKADRSEVATGNVSFHTILSNTNIADVITNDVANGKLDFKLKLNAGTKDMAYFAFCTTGTDISRIIITVNEEIV